MLTVTGIVILVLFAVVVAFMVADARFDQRVRNEVASALPAGAPGVFHYDMLTGLPAPVQRYFRYAIPEGHPMLQSAKVTQTGRYRGSPEQAWMDFTAQEYMTQNDFIWHVRMRPFPLFWIEGRDHYLHGEGSMQINAYSLVPIVNAKPERFINQSALSRFLLEAAWIPTALLPTDDLRWEAMDDNRARMVVTDANGFETWVEFTFNEAGEIIEGRGNRFLEGEEGIWKAEASNYETFDGVRVPTRNTAYWLTEDGSAWDYVHVNTQDVQFNITLEDVK